MFVVKDKILNDIIFETLPFGVNDHLFFCNRYFYFEKYCCFCTRFHVRDKALSHFSKPKSDPFSSVFPKELLSDNIFVTDNVSVFVH